MRKVLVNTLLLSSIIFPTSIFATNGSVLIGIGAKSRAMGGTAIGVDHGPDSALINPSLISSVQGNEISFGGTLFMPDVSNSMGQAGSMSADKTSLSDKNVIPSVSLTTKSTDSFYWGVGMWGTAGMGVDYRNSANNFNMVTNLQIMQFGVPLAYTIDNLSIGITPVIQYGSLDISYKGTLDTSSIGPATNDVGHDSGVSQDLAMGYNLGFSYKVDNATLGFSYKSKIDMVYDSQLSGASSDFVAFGLFGGNRLKNTLSTPAEIGIGSSYKIQNHTFALDLKQIQWSDTDGYKDFEWDGQTVVSLGYEFATNLWAIRLGYNYGENPIDEQATSSVDATSSVINMLNLLGFPAIVESHFTIGGSFIFAKRTSFDFAYMYAPEVTKTYSTAQFSSFGPTNPTQIETSHSQSSLSVGLSYMF